MLVPLTLTLILSPSMENTYAQIRRGKTLYILKTIHKNQTDRTSCRIKTVYETAKQIAVIAIRKMMYGKTTMMLWPSGSGPEKRLRDIISIGPTRMLERVVFFKGLIIVAVPSV